MPRGCVPHTCPAGPKHLVHMASLGTGRRVGTWAIIVQHIAMHPDGALIQGPEGCSRSCTMPAHSIIAPKVALLLCSRVDHEAFQQVRLTLAESTLSEGVDHTRSWMETPGLRAACRHKSSTSGASGSCTSCASHTIGLFYPNTNSRSLVPQWRFEVGSSGAPASCPDAPLRWVRTTPILR